MKLVRRRENIRRKRQYICSRNLRVFSSDRSRALISKTPVIVPSISSLDTIPASLEKPSMRGAQNHIPNAPMNHESEISEADMFDSPSSLLERAANSSDRRFECDRDDELDGTTAAIEKRPHERKMCLGVRKETEARLAKAKGGEA